MYDLVEHMKPTPGANSKSAKRRPTVSSQFRVGKLCFVLSTLISHKLFSNTFLTACFFSHHSDFADITDDNPQPSSSLFCEMY